MSGERDRTGGVPAGLVDVEVDDPAVFAERAAERAPLIAVIGVDRAVDAHRAGAGAARLRHLDAAVARRLGTAGVDGHSLDGHLRERPTLLAPWAGERGRPPLPVRQDLPARRGRAAVSEDEGQVKKPAATKAKAGKDNDDDDDLDGIPF